MILADMNPPCLPDLGENTLFETDRQRLIEQIKAERVRVLSMLGERLAQGEDTGSTAAARLAHWTDVLITGLFEQIQHAKPERPSHAHGAGRLGRLWARTVGAAFGHRLVVPDSKPHQR